MKAEDALDVWARERSETLIGTNHALKKDALGQEEGRPRSSSTFPLPK